MKKRTDFTDNAVTYPLNFNEFNDLDYSIKKKLMRLMARISEKSYRRGFHHGLVLKPTVDMVKFRYKISLDKAPFTHVVGENGKWVCSKDTAIERLAMEYPELRDVGFPIW